MYLYETNWEPSFIHSPKLSSSNCCSSSQKITQQSNIQDYHEENPTSCRTGLVPVDLIPKSCIIKESKEPNPMRSTTKAQALQQFKYNWMVTKSTDKVEKREAWGIFTDELCREGYITMKKYESWSNPF